MRYLFISSYARRGFKTSVIKVTFSGNISKKTILFQLSAADTRNFKELNSWKLLNGLKEKSVIFGKIYNEPTNID